jgi:hypothetical protein
MLSSNEEVLMSGGSQTRGKQIGIRVATKEPVSVAFEGDDLRKKNDNSL